MNRMHQSVAPVTFPNISAASLNLKTTTLSYIYTISQKTSQ